jgi:hypothetical protein
VAGAVPLLESALANLAAAETRQRELLPDIDGGLRERALVAAVLERARERVARGVAGAWDPEGPD